VAEQGNQTPYEILGDGGIRALASAFYDVMDELPQAADVRAMHADNLEVIKRKLATYLTGWMGGPPIYLAMNGTVCLTDPHEPYAIGPKERDQWLLCMHEALERIDASYVLKAMLMVPLFLVADTVRNQDDSTPKPQPKPRDPNIIAVG
jgi:hemoglobin